MYPTARPQSCVSSRKIIPIAKLLVENNEIYVTRKKRERGGKRDRFFGRDSWQTLEKGWQENHREEMGSENSPFDRWTLRWK